METKHVSEAIAFAEAKMRKISLFESPHLFYDLYCLLPGQAQKVHAHDGSDKVYFVLEGTGTFTVGEEVRSLGPGHAVFARSGAPHGVENAGEANLVLLVTMAPRPGA